MKKLILVTFALIAMNTLSGCQTSGSSANTPSLSPDSRPTSRMPSPGNIQRSNLMQSRMMTPPN